LIDYENLEDMINEFNHQLNGYEEYKDMEGDGEHNEEDK
jgi:hypothetical protein